MMVFTNTVAPKPQNKCLVMGLKNSQYIFKFPKTCIIICITE